MKIEKYLIIFICLIILSILTNCNSKSPTKPLLLLSTERDFGNYAAEILKTEGFNAFHADSVKSRAVSLSYLKKFELVILADSDIDSSGLNDLKSYVKSGGDLIVLHPEEKLADLLGVVPTHKIITSGYIGIDTTTSQGRGLTSSLLQFHGEAALYSLNGASAIAGLCSRKNSIEKYPAIISNNYGEGHAIAFLYNLPENIVLTRQGNPNSAGMEKDGIIGQRGMDLFTDGWVDTSNNCINQADVHMAFLSHCIEYLLDSKMPVPHFWYFPDTLKCLVTLTNDGEYKSESDFEPQFRDVDSLGAKMSLYVLGIKKVSRTWVDKWTSKEFEISGHPDDTREAADPQWISMDRALRLRGHEIDSAYGLPSRTNVNHWFVWCGKDVHGNQEFGAEARLEEKNGIEMDVNYAHYDMNSNQGDHYLGSPGLDQGNFTGSGLVMKFADSRGKLINVYQNLNAVYDQEYNESNDPDGFYNCFKGLMDRSMNNDVYSFISVKSHNDEYYFSRSPLLKMLNYARGNNIPVWTELELLDFLKARDEASFSDFNWTGQMLTFKLFSNIKNSSGITFLLPVDHNDMKIRDIHINGEPIKYKKWRIKGHAYTPVTLSPGNNYDISVKYE